MLALAASDGTVDFRDRDTLESVTADGDDAKVTSLPQAGFAFLGGEACTDVAMSHNACMILLTRPDDVLHLSTMDYLNDWSEARLDDCQTQAALACIAREFALLTSQQYAADEVLALVPPTLGLDMRCFIVSHIHRFLQRSVDYSSDEPQKQSQRALRDSLLYRLLSVQLVLCYKGLPIQPDSSSKLAWVFLNLKSISTSIAHTVPPRDTPQAGECPRIDVSSFD